MGNHGYDTSLHAESEYDKSPELEAASGEYMDNLICSGRPANMAIAFKAGVRAEAKRIAESRAETTPPFFWFNAIAWTIMLPLVVAWAVLMLRNHRASMEIIDIQQKRIEQRDAVIDRQRELMEETHKILSDAGLTHKVTKNGINDKSKIATWGVEKGIKIPPEWMEEKK